MQSSLNCKDNEIVISDNSIENSSVNIKVEAKEKRKILSEEQYVKNLEKLIVRDYFPELPKLKAQAEYLEALAKNDQIKIRELQVRYDTKKTNCQTSPSARAFSPSVFDPDSPGPSKRLESPYFNFNDDHNSTLKKNQKTTSLDNLTVQSYLDQYTSEDNASFEELTELQNQRRRVRNAWMYEAEQRHNESFVYRDSKPITAADEQLVAKKNKLIPKSIELDNWKYKAQNAVLFNVDEAPLTMMEYVERTKRNEKIINKEATRFNFDYIKNSNKFLSQTVLKKTLNNIGHIDVTGKEIKKINQPQLGLICTPSPTPGIENSPFMTWGEIDGTPFQINGTDFSSTINNAPTFKIPELPLRERVAQDITDHIAQNYHGKRINAVNQIQKIAAKVPTFDSVKNSEKMTTMSPAAKRFATDKLGIRIGTDKIKMSPLTFKKTPKQNFYSPALHKMIKIKKETVSSSNTPKVQNNLENSVTDNLFNLPPSPPPQSKETFLKKNNETHKRANNRLTASDFF